MEPPIIKVSGPSDSGKTQLICRLIRRLTQGGWKVAVIKHDPRDHWEWDHPGTDTQRLAEAGAYGVSILSPRRFGLYQRRNKELSLGDLADKFDPDPDLVIVEGFKERSMWGFQKTRDGWLDHRGEHYGANDVERMANSVQEWLEASG